MRYLLPSLLILTGCVSPAKFSPITVAAAEEAKARYRAIQEAQKPPPPADFEILPLMRPERTEDGITRAPSTDYVRIPRIP